MSDAYIRNWTFRAHDQMNAYKRKLILQFLHLLSKYFLAKYLVIFKIYSQMITYLSPGWKPTGMQ